MRINNILCLMQTNIILHSLSPPTLIHNKLKGEKLA